MDREENLNLNNLEFLDDDFKENSEFLDNVKELNFFPKLCMFLGFKILKNGSKLAVFPYMYSPIRLANIIEFEKGIIENLVDRLPNLSESIKLDDSKKNALLKHYDKEFMMAIGRASIFYLIAIYPIAIIMSFGLSWLAKKLQSIPTEIFSQALINTATPSLPFILVNSVIKGFLSLIPTLLTTFFAVIVIAIVVRIVRSIVYKQSAGSLCVANALYIVIELNRAEILINPKKRRKLIHRINSLAQTTIFLPQYYKYTSQVSQDWLEEHFKNMAFFILERGRWAIAPTQSTLEDLRRDFHKLAEIYITGKYGEFKWVTMPSQSQSKLNWRAQMLMTVAQMLNVAIPVILLIPSVNKNINVNGVQSGILSLILISWLLVSVDSILKLGIIKNFIDLSKGIKDLK